MPDTDLAWKSTASHPVAPHEPDRTGHRDDVDRHAPGSIAYIIKGFPRLSETFIAQEIHLLEAMGLSLRLFSVKPGEHERVHDVVRRIRAPIDYLPEATSLSATTLARWLRINLPQFRDAHRTVFRRGRLRYLRTLLAALAMCWRYRTGPLAPPRKVFIKEFLQAGEIAHRILLEGRVAHLHGHFCHGATTITWFVSRLTGLPFSFTAHAKDIYQPDSNPGDLLPRKIAAARFVTTCTGANQTHLAARFPHHKPVHTVYHGLDTAYFSPAARSDAVNDGPPLILAVGRLVEKKGFIHLIDACHQLRARGIAFRCAIVGERGDQSDLLAQRIADLGLSDMVQLPGPKTQTELRQYYAQAAVFALPCLITDDGDRDGIPNVMAEAMAMGLPVVSTPISGIPELVADEVEGLLVPPRDSTALAVALARLLADPALSLRIASAARARICERFDARKTTLKLRDLFLAELDKARVAG